MRKKLKKQRSIPYRMELMALVKDMKAAILLQQVIYWTEKTEERDAAIWKRIEAMRKAGAKEEEIEELLEELRDGWYYKTLDMWKEDLFNGMSVPTISRKLKDFEKKGWIETRNDPNLKLDQGRWYRANLFKIHKDLQKLGYALHGYAPLPMEAEEEPPREEEEVQVAKPLDFHLFNWVENKEGRG